MAMVRYHIFAKTPILAFADTRIRFFNTLKEAVYGKPRQGVKVARLTFYKEPVVNPLAKCIFLMEQILYDGNDNFHHLRLLCFH